jgi:hypothetical protein
MLKHVVHIVATVLRSGKSAISYNILHTEFHNILSCSDLDVNLLKISVLLAELINAEDVARFAVLP